MEVSKWQEIKEYLLTPVEAVERFFSRIQTVIYFLPKIWAWRPWDYRYNIDLFAYGLKKQAQLLESEDCHIVEGPQKAREIRTTLKLIEKVYGQDSYEVEWVDKIEEKWGEGITDFDFEEFDQSNHSKIVWKWEKHPQSKIIKSEITEESEKARQKQEKAHRLLWKYIEHRIRGWWD